LRIEGAKPFAATPTGLHRGRTWPPIWWWTRRQTLAEEQQWRATLVAGKPTNVRPHPKRVGWYQEKAPPWLQERTGHPPERLDADHVAVLYRALRKAQEDSKNEPGAADFYYGEMEMRRLSKATP
jgi:hypothetical protein